MKERDYWKEDPLGLLPCLPYNVSPVVLTLLEGMESAEEF